MPQALSQGPPRQAFILNPHDGPQGWHRPACVTHEGTEAQRFLSQSASPGSSNPAPRQLPGTPLCLSTHLQAGHLATLSLSSPSRPARESVGLLWVEMHLRRQLAVAVPRIYFEGPERG